MDKFKRSLSFRKKRDSTPESSKPHQWQEDEKKVREGTCSFQVRYLGCIEVFESRGIQVCEEAIKGLKSQGKGKYQRAILYVSGDALRVVDEISKGLIVDQTIEKVSFCAPDRNNDKGFAYICRDGTTRRWMCHGFLALKESGERLSHAVGCAFTVCLEKKQAREKEKVTVTFNENGTSFTRTGSFRQTTLTERLADPQSAIIAEPVPVKITENLYEIQRPRASVDMMQRQNSFRGFSKLAETSPFKRQMSLRLDELSATTDRLKRFVEEDGLATTASTAHSAQHAAISPIMEASPMTEPTDSISQMCQQVTYGLSALTLDDPFLVVPSVARLGTSSSAGGGTSGVVGATGRTLSASESQTNTPRRSVLVNASSGGSATAPILAEPVRQSNPWSSPATHSKVSDADFWLRSTANIVGGPKNPTAVPPQPYVANGVAPQSSQYSGFAVPSQRSFAGTDQHFSIIQRAPHLTHIRAHSVDSAYSNQYPGNQQSGYQAIIAAQRKGNAALTGQNNNFTGMWNTSAPGTMPGVGQPAYDPFDAAWAAKVAGRDTNPFHSIDSSNKSFEVKL